MADKKTSQFGTITSVQANAAGTEGYIPYIDPSQTDPDLRNKRMTRTEAKKFFGLDVFTALSGTAWDGSNKTLTLTSNTALTFSSTRRNGILRVKQDGTGSRTLSINGVSVPVLSGANTMTVITFFFDDVAATYVFSYDTNILGNVGGSSDTTPPTIVSATATDATHVTVVFNENVTATIGGWGLYNGSTTFPMLSVSGSGTTWTFVVNGTMLSTDTLGLIYTAASGNTLDTAGNEMSDVSNFGVTNSIGGGTFPTLNRVGFWKEADMVKAGGIVTSWPETTSNGKNWTPVTGFEPTDEGANGLGSDGGKQMTASSFALNSPCTIYAWINRTGTGEVLGNSGGGYFLYMDGSSVLTRPSASTYATNSNAVPTGSFKVVCLTIASDGTCKLYIDGTLTGSFDTPISPTTFNVSTLLGETPAGGSGSLTGYMKRLAIFNTEHTGSQVSSNSTSFIA